MKRRTLNLEVRIKKPLRNSFTIEEAEID